MTLTFNFWNDRKSFNLGIKKENWDWYLVYCLLFLYWTQEVFRSDPFMVRAYDRVVDGQTLEFHYDNGVIIDQTGSE